jgi:hypothetical protein
VKHGKKSHAMNSFEHNPKLSLEEYNMMKDGNSLQSMAESRIMGEKSFSLPYLMPASVKNLTTDQSNLINITSSSLDLSM